MGKFWQLCNLDEGVCVCVCVKVRKQRDMRGHYTTPLTFQYVWKLSYIIGGNPPAVGIFNMSRYLSCPVSMVGGMWTDYETPAAQSLPEFRETSYLRCYCLRRHTFPTPLLAGEMFRRLTFLDTSLLSQVIKNLGCKCLLFLNGAQTSSYQTRDTEF